MPAAALALVIASGSADVALAHADTAPLPLPPEAQFPVPVSPDVPGHPTAAGHAPQATAVSAPSGNRSNLTAAAVLHDGEDVDLIPTPALAAYQRTEAIIAAAAPDCHLDWTVIAAVGQVLTEHGRLDEKHALDDDGAATPPIMGPVIRDVRGQRLADSDAGDLDGDRRHDRAVGPMLLAPAAWRHVGVDGDSDGMRNPQDIDDAALAAAVLLCAPGDDLRRPRHLTNALERMNARPEFARSVSEVAAAYANDVVTSAPVPTFTTASVALTREVVAASPPPPDQGAPVAKVDASKDAGPDRPDKAAKNGKPAPAKQPEGNGKNQKGKGKAATKKDDPAPPTSTETEEPTEATPPPTELAEEVATEEPTPEPAPEPEPDPEPEAAATTEDEATATCEESTEPEDTAAPACDGATTSEGTDPEESEEP